MRPFGLSVLDIVKTSDREELGVSHADVKKASREYNNAMKIERVCSCQQCTSVPMHIDVKTPFTSVHARKMMPVLSGMVSQSNSKSKDPSRMPYASRGG
jgi:predicted aldo/keto reductase-like oxidoreductase